MKTQLALLLALVPVLAIADRDPFLPPSTQVSAELLNTLALMEARLLRTEDTIRDLEAFLIEMQEGAPTADAAAPKPILIGQSADNEYYRMPDGTIFVRAKDSEERRPRSPLSRPQGSAEQGAVVPGGH